MRRVVRPLATLVVSLLVLITAFVPSAQAQDFDEIVQELEQNGYYIERGAEGSDSGFRNLVERADATGETWYFVSLDGTVSGSYADDLFETLTPQGNVLLYFLDDEGFANVQFATDESVSSATQSRALEAFDDDWDQPEDFMEDVVRDYSELTGTSSSSSGSSGSSSGSTGSSGASESSGSSGGGFPWGWVLIPLVLIGGIWFMSRRSKNKRDDEDLETAQKIRAELQTELDELANDVLVLSGPVDVADNDQVTTYYREATDTYLDISEELPDVEKLEDADLQELSVLGTRVSHARWQMDAAEALMNGEPLPEKPKVPPPPVRAPRQDPRPRARQMPQRQPRPRVPYSRSRRRSGGGLLDILIAGAGMMGGRSGGGMYSGRRGGGMFGGGRSGGGMFGGGSSRTRTPSRTPSRSQPRSGGGVFGRSGGSSAGRSGRSTRSTRSSSGRRPRSSGRKSRSTSRRRRR